MSLALAKGSPYAWGIDGAECYGSAPAAEECDLTDNDCDGLIDEDFTSAPGVFGLDTHCGGCNIDCNGRVPNATAVVCDVGGEEPACVALGCEPGFQLIDGQACVPIPRCDLRALCGQRYLQLTLTRLCLRTYRRPRNS